ncbi:bifunctional phosphopantothenoylcysteine decarboxylase/phosphopantothenate--cysteine ligase CoaBC [Candidatus Acetothermia bacterium]|jgi:phosphopantothenoylcysteine decarboxylase/phosphopantothenate--cysteine ligase|nr:bifunctional phosphopantothenoylcysteine decarboxylase/phosphopantothenate--cysteine ligase CoaBC [Candidatus Acetothermia bacterium]MCI2432550.1 bifunctional phosphopantothenoylcysteine decarboxylase/phosphopantothenate--cysteine ligase CoaBC [Candidatus Acetothermia bacterium]MCI2435873.1 bifunctional phosphopantothenoylcysteine decarboxylase/phosphopantothenate--cysteine ligase CoaBC [Candidatus Acetothermia bacterium]
MDACKGKKIVAGICGGIAVYKAAYIVSKLVQAGASVRVIMTRAACEFVTPLTFESLSQHRVFTDLFRDDPLAHVELAHTADLFVLMPATYNIIGKLAHGIADDFLTTTVAATRAPLLVIPAMESQMYTNPVFQENKKRLSELGYRFLEPETGHLASGRSGVGRFPSEEKIFKAIEEIFAERSLLKGRRVLVTAGPTREMLDPMRCITNKSSGKMGYALAEQARNLGADSVCLVSGPTLLEPPVGVEFVKVESAAEMHKAVTERFPKFDLILMAAAVADWRPKKAFSHKLKKSDARELTLVLEKTPDILSELGRRKKKNQILVGFAAETEKILEHAREKLRAKNLDLVVANDITAPGAGPEVETNIVTLLYRDGRSRTLPCMTKCEVAREVLREIARLL